MSLHSSSFLILEKFSTSQPTTGRFGVPFPFPEWVDRPILDPSQIRFAWISDSRRIYTPDMREDALKSLALAQVERELPEKGIYAFFTDGGKSAQDRSEYIVTDSKQCSTMYRAC